ncbi:MAG: type II toxin-antitoxin system RelE/ParE family toxin [Alphaproteobacteria bacterium]|nr:type II toxin-antitoxin system RelE/ParE family toxin [Alphaproteobacteria bacterium]
MPDKTKRNLSFVGSSLKDLQGFPQKVKRQVGFDLDIVQNGETPSSAKRLKGFSGVMELVERYNKDTYRAVYVVNIDDIIYVLHCFKKKSKQGIKTPKADIDLIKQRLKEAQDESKRSKGHDK